MKDEEFKGLLQDHWPELGFKEVELVVKYYRLVLQENEVQNLTRLVSPSDFLYGHVLDVQELLKSGLLTFPAMDLGSGCGVPGLLAALVSSGSWILAEGEGHKAEFLRKAVLECGVEDRVQVFRGRAEDFFKSGYVESVVARAVGPVERIFGWIRNCSTWNKLVLLKGPGWGDEWQSFKMGRDRKRLLLSRTHEYSVGPDQKKRIIVELERVPRGT